MSPRVPVLAAACLLLLAAAGRGQTTAVVGPGGPQLTLQGMNGADPFAAAAADPGERAGTWDVAVGFNYLRPRWATRGLNLRAAGANRAVGVVEPFADLTDQFGFVPRLDVQYNPVGLGFGVATSAQFLAVGGTLERTVTLTDGGAASADLIATSNLTILTVDFAQITRAVRAGDVFDHPLVCRLGREDDTYQFSVGTRYSALRQTWNAALRSGGSNASADASQTFSGLGLTAGVASDHPVGERWGVYTNNRVSLLVGPNARKSVASGTDATGPFTNTLVENRTVLLPVVEYEVGVRHLSPLDPARFAADGTGPLLSVRVGFVGQVWGKSGFLPAAGGDARFSDRPLYLLGVSVFASIQY